LKFEYHKFTLLVYIHEKKNILLLFIDFSYFTFFRKSQKNSPEKEVNQNHQWLQILILFSLWFQWFKICKSTMRIVLLLKNSVKKLKKCLQDSYNLMSRNKIDKMQSNRSLLFSTAKIYNSYRFLARRTYIRKFTGILFKHTII
jgi:hypothetical protein